MDALARAHDLVEAMKGHSICLGPRTKFEAAAEEIQNTIGRVANKLAATFAKAQQRGTIPSPAPSPGGAGQGHASWEVVSRDGRLFVVDSAGFDACEVLEGPTGKPYFQSSTTRRADWISMIPLYVAFVGAWKECDDAEHKAGSLLTEDAMNAFIDARGRLYSIAAEIDPQRVRAQERAMRASGEVAG